MSLGYIKGKFWHPDERYARYAELSAYKALMNANVAAGFSTNVEYSYTSRRYMAEIITIERFSGSNQPYFVKHNNKYDPNPMVALTGAIRESGRATPRVLACCLEIECELLREQVAAARRREAAMAKLEAAIDLLGDVIRAAGHMFAYADGSPPDDPQQDEYDRWTHLIIHGKPRPSDEDDDL